MAGDINDEHDTDVVKCALIDSVAMHRGGDSTWAKAWAVTLQRLGLTVDALHNDTVPGDMHLNLMQVMDAVDDRWMQCMYAPIPQEMKEHEVRQVPHNLRTGFTIYRYSTWCKPSAGAYLKHVHTEQRVYTLARFRLGAHRLLCEDHSKRRENRVCSRCGMHAIEDEMHVFECPSYQYIRLGFPELFDSLDVHETGWTDSVMRHVMDQGDDAHRWNMLADYLIRVFAARENAPTLAGG